MATAFSLPNLQTYMQSVGNALRANDTARACGIAGEAVSRGFANAQLLTLAAYDQINRGNDSGALELARRARDEAPRSVDVLTVLALSQWRNGQLREALANYDLVLRQSPASTQQRFSKACILEELGEIARATRAFERVLDGNPNHLEAMAHLANLAVQRGDAKSAREYGTQLQTRDPNNIPAALALAGADVEDGRFEDALKRIAQHRSNASAINLAIGEGTMGDAFDGLGQTAEAFAAYEASNATLREFYLPRFAAPGMENAFVRVNRLKEYFSSASSECWTVNPGVAAQSPVSTHVFLVGFPRSGTTLLEQILAAHPDIESLEERDNLIDAANDFLIDSEGAGRLEEISVGALEIYRQKYWARVQETGTRLKQPVFVDKMPLNTVLLCLIAKLFPAAKILFALRDPRDVVLSCFRRRFGMSAQMYEFTSLESTAHYYDAVMQLASEYRRLLGLKIFDVRYEKIVTNLEPQARALCNFIGVPWNDAMTDFAARAKNRGINTPSAAQVARGLYTQGMNHWRRYEKQLAPVMPLLNPWVARFGY